MYYFDGLRTVCFSLNLECNAIEGRKESSRNPGWCQGLQRVSLSNLLCQRPVDQNTLLFRTYIWQNAEARRDHTFGQRCARFADGGVTSGFRGAIFFDSLLCLAGWVHVGVAKGPALVFLFLRRRHQDGGGIQGAWLSIQVLKLARKTHCAQEYFFRFVCIS